MIKIEIPKGADIKSPAVILSTWFGSGLLSPAPGTWGSLAALPFAYALSFTSPEIFIASIILISLIGYWAADKFETATEIHDSKAVVIDEVAGQWLALLPIVLLSEFSLMLMGLGFLLFRLFDILKPWPISYCDKHIKGALGVMLDDILAGLAAAILLTGVIYAGFG